MPSDEICLELPEPIIWIVAYRTKDAHEQYQRFVSHDQALGIFREVQKRDDVVSASFGVEVERFD